MHIITIMNYKKRNEITMCKAWIYFAKRFNPSATITIFHVDPIHDIKLFAKRYKNTHFLKLSLRDVRPTLSRGYVDHPAQELRLAVWKQTEKRKINKFIYVDADAFILGSLKTWWRHIGDKPYIAVNQQMSPNSTFINAGVHSYSSTSHFISYRKLLRQYQRDGNVIKGFGGEQWLINAYFQHIGYDPTHPIINFTYNCFAKYCRIQTISDTRVSVCSGRYPFIKNLARMVTRTQPQWWERWAWWNREEPVIILHAFGKTEFKFWELPECKSLWEYCQKIEST